MSRRLDQLIPSPRILSILPSASHRCRPMRMRRRRTGNVRIQNVRNGRKRIDRPFRRQPLPSDPGVPPPLRDLLPLDVPPLPHGAPHHRPDDPSLRPRRRSPPSLPRRLRRRHRPVPRRRRRSPLYGRQPRSRHGQGRGIGSHGHVPGVSSSAGARRDRGSSRRCQGVKHRRPRRRSAGIISVDGGGEAVPVGRGGGDSSRSSARRRRHGRGRRRSVNRGNASLRRAARRMVPADDQSSRRPLPVLTGLGQFLKILLGVRSNLHHRPGLDESGDFLPALAVLFEALEEEAVLFGRPAAGVFGDGGGVGAGVGGVRVAVVVVVVGSVVGGGLAGWGGARSRRRRGSAGRNGDGREARGHGARMGMRGVRLVVEMRRGVRRRRGVVGWVSRRRRRRGLCQRLRLRWCRSGRGWRLRGWRGWRAGISMRRRLGGGRRRAKRKGVRGRGRRRRRSRGGPAHAGRTILQRRRSRRDGSRHRSGGDGRHGRRGGRGGGGFRRWKQRGGDQSRPHVGMVGIGHDFCSDDCGVGIGLGGFRIVGLDGIVIIIISIFD
mmetsp:Transcript_9038/g.19249  ORF Transcript_9038/g.19249 Transcript_9038/m.19249 type:complete len:549 (+) Transcript_9038:1448-3094(+)